MTPALLELGLTPFFTQQLSAGELDNTQPARIIEVQRTGVTASDGDNQWLLPLGGAWFKLPADERPTVGDWVLLDAPRQKILRLLDRKSVFKRVVAGNRSELQLIAANVDTLFVVTSCNEEFNESRLERYLALALEAGVEPVVVLSKADLSGDGESYRQRAQTVSRTAPVELVNALDPASLERLGDWVSPGTTVALVGSSGVGKSTIVNSLARAALADTGAIREQDAKGRHTTTFRSLHRLHNGGLLLDVPGIRELKIAEMDESLADLFTDVEALVQHCKFSNCGHGQEPGCAVRLAISEGRLDPRRLSNYQKLRLEEARNSSSIAERRKYDRKFSKSVQAHLQMKRDRGDQNN